MEIWMIDTETDNVACFSSLGLEFRKGRARDLLPDVTSNYIALGIGDSNPVKVRRISYCCCVPTLLLCGNSKLTSFFCFFSHLISCF